MSDRWHLKSGEVFDSEERGVALISTTYLARGAGTLIAAAPDLLEALTDAIGALEYAGHGSDDPEMCPACAAHAKATTAIAKAESR